MNPILKYLITAGIIVIVSEVAKKSDKLGAFIVAMPMVTILAMVWIFMDTGQEQGDKVRKLSDHAAYTFWYVVPTLPMFLVMPLLFKKGIHFSFVMVIYCLGTFAIFYVWAKLLEKFGVYLLP